VSTATLPEFETNEAYHADTTAISHSMLDCFGESATRFYRRFVLKDWPAEKPSKSLRIGSAVHASILEPHRFADLVAISEDREKRSNADKAWWAEFEAANAGKTILNPSEADAAALMTAAIHVNDTAHKLVAWAGKRERRIDWVDQTTGIACKCKPDLLTDNGMVIDLKTAGNPDPSRFAWACSEYGYHRQAAFYLDGIEAALGPADRKFLFVVVGNEPPYEVATYWMQPDAIELGRKQNRELLDRLAVCLADDEWINPWSVGVNCLTLPKWVFTKESNQ